MDVVGVWSEWVWCAGLGSMLLSRRRVQRLFLTAPYRYRLDTTESQFLGTLGWAPEQSG